MKAVNVKVLDVRKVTDVSDCMVLASGNSDRHVRSIADRVVERAKAAGFRPIGVEGERDGEWVLVDLNDVLVHVMLPRVREFYGLEELWEAPPAAPKPRNAAGRKPVRRKAPVACGRKSARKSARPRR
jgi:ribosome-associated protein